LSDIFREVEEDVRRERLEKFWKRYGNWMIALVVLILAGVGGWQYWQRLQAEERARTSDAFAAAQRITTDPARAATAFADIAKTARGSYGLLAKLSQANALQASGQIKPAIDLYKEVAAADDGEIGAVARLRVSWILASSAPRSELDALLAPLNKDDSAWQPLAREIFAFSDYRAAKVKQAAATYRALADDPKSPGALRNRARAMAAFLDTGAGSDFGTVPATPPADALKGALPAATPAGTPLPVPAPAK
jgi:hypothetical protein